ncbi:hypothetical protein [Actinomyces ruminis]|uniref:Uncharacterized protein n=1 Tax=Actinomyces ruminis TaxID=1937003 RepID=A0ABX4MAU4_9ACTO|nr:hypothetical protein [Actinomyces ruminis]PHP52574.1 hypothetical protein BW737_008810 [Actinomyces ruminis]
MKVIVRIERDLADPIEVIEELPAETVDESSGSDVVAAMAREAAWADRLVSWAASQARSRINAGGES